MSWPDDMCHHVYFPWGKQHHCLRHYLTASMSRDHFVKFSRKVLVKKGKNILKSTYFDSLLTFRVKCIVSLLKCSCSTCLRGITFAFVIAGIFGVLHYISWLLMTTPTLLTWCWIPRIYLDAIAEILFRICFNVCVTTANMQSRSFWWIVFVFTVHIF